MMTSINASKKENGNEEYLYSAIYTAHSLKALRHGSHSFTCKYTMSAFLRSVHHMLPLPNEVTNIQFQRTTQTL